MAVANNTRIITRKVRLSYVHLFKPYAAAEGQEEKYSATILIPKSDIATKAKLDAAIEVAAKNGDSKVWNGKRPAKLAIPIYDGDGTRPSDGEPYGAECKGHWVMTASTKVDKAPGVVDRFSQPILDQSEVYSGMYGRVSVTFFPYAFGGKKGIGVALNNVQKLADGEPLSAMGIRAEDEFDAVELDPITGDIIG